MALTIKEIENAKPKAKKYKMLDGGGLSLFVLPTGTKHWLWRYQFDGGEKNMAFGEYPLDVPRGFVGPESYALAENTAPASS